ERAPLTAGGAPRGAAYRATPAGTPRGGLVVVQEIFGVNSHIKRTCDGFAADGYVALAPALFDRVQRDYATGYSPADIEAGRAVGGKATEDCADGDDLAAARELGRGGPQWGGGGSGRG